MFYVIIDMDFQLLYSKKAWHKIFCSHKHSQSPSAPEPHPQTVMSFWLLTIGLIQFPPRKARSAAGYSEG